MFSRELKENFPRNFTLGGGQPHPTLFHWQTTRVLPRAGLAAGFHPGTVREMKGGTQFSTTKRIALRKISKASVKQNSCLSHKNERKWDQHFFPLKMISQPLQGPRTCCALWSRNSEVVRDPRVYTHTHACYRPEGPPPRARLLQERTSHTQLLHGRQPPLALAFSTVNPAAYTLLVHWKLPRNSRYTARFENLRLLCFLLLSSVSQF